MMVQVIDHRMGFQVAYETDGPHDAKCDCATQITSGHAPALISATHLSPPPENKRKAKIRVPTSGPCHARKVGQGGGCSVERHDTQAGKPSAQRLWAQLAFKDLMVRGILQFTPSIAFRYVLHRCKGQDIRCRESSHKFKEIRRTTAT